MLINNKKGGFMKKIFTLIYLLAFYFISFAQQLPNLPIPIGAGNAEVWNNEIYHFGGSNNWSGSIVYPRVYKFDGNNWAYHDTIPDDNVWDVETLLVGDYTYLIGGWPSGPSLNRRYDMNTGEWVYLTESPNTYYTWGITSEVLNGIIYLFNPDGECFAYNIAGDNWVTKTQNSASGYWDMSSILYQNEVYIIGWSDSAFYKYTPSSDQWTRLANSPYPVGACAFGVINNLIYCVGGNEGGATTASYKSIIVYDITTNSWAVDAQELSSKRHWMATAEYEGGLYVVGGIDSMANAVDIVEEIVPQGTQGVDDDFDIPQGFFLEQNYPNPFNPSTKITYSIPEVSFVTLKVYDVLGNETATLVNEEKTPGNYEIEFIAANLPSGIYFYKLITNNFIETKKMMLLK
jgi:hypothetical protein